MSEGWQSVDTCRLDDIFALQKSSLCTIDPEIVIDLIPLESE